MCVAYISLMRHPWEVDERVLTLKEAASHLGVSPQRISQMLKDGDLDGPPQRPGARAPRNAPRVYMASLEERVARHAKPQRERGRAAMPSEAALRDDAHRLKLALDVARDQIARQRQQNERLVALLAEAVAALREEQALARDADQITEQYAAIATNHLAPDALTEER